MSSSKHGKHEQPAEGSAPSREGDKKRTASNWTRVFPKPYNPGYEILPSTIRTESPSKTSIPSSSKGPTSLEDGEALVSAFYGFWPKEGPEEVPPKLTKLSTLEEPKLENEKMLSDDEEIPTKKSIALKEQIERLERHTGALEINNTIDRLESLRIGRYAASKRRDDTIKKYHQNKYKEIKQIVAAMDSSRINRGPGTFGSPIVHDASPMDHGHDSETPVPLISDARTTYSETIECYHAAGLPDAEKYVTELAEMMCKEISRALDKEVVLKALQNLPEYLGAFALRLSHTASTQMHHNTAAFVHKYQEQIAESFRGKISSEVGDAQAQVLLDSDSMSLKERMDLWDLKLEVQKEYIDPENPRSTQLELRTPKQKNLVSKTRKSYSSSENEMVPVLQEMKPTIVMEMPLVTEYKALISTSGAYEWLIKRLQREINLQHTSRADGSMMDIREKILSCLDGSTNISTKKRTRSFIVGFMVGWCPLQFISEQKYNDGKNTSNSLEDTITITGSWYDDAQALTCIEYMHQTWPFGEYTMMFLQNVYKKGGGIFSAELPDGTKLVARARESRLFLEVSGTKDSIAEIGEQVAWLAAACSTHIKGPAICKPNISRMHARGASGYHWLPGLGGGRKNDTTSSHWVRAVWGHHESNRNTIFSEWWETKTKDCFISIGRFLSRSFARSNPSGQCWHNLFRNPAVVPGFPIARRARQNTGLEIPINILMGLIGTHAIDTFDEKLIIKGFLSMLVATEKFDDMLMWHLLYKDPNAPPEEAAIPREYNYHNRSFKPIQRISYLESRGISCHLGSFGLSEIESSRHFVGWCYEALYKAGSKDAIYTVAPSRLPRAHHGCKLEKVRLRPGYFVGGGSPFAIGHRDIPIHVASESHVLKLKWIHAKYVVLWDEQDKRGWLVNGTSALLHLLRASLNHDSESDFKSNFLFKWEDLKEPFVSDKSNYAVNLLQNETNMNVEIFPGVKIKNRFDEIYQQLNKIIDYQIGLSEENSNNEPRPRKYLEGWDFNDLAIGRDPINPRVAEIRTIGKSWIDLTRDIHAVTLFGRGFGEIIQPVDMSQCRRWSSVPKDNYYLAATIHDLKKIMLADGDPDANPLRLTGSTIWKTYGRGVEQCICLEEQQTSDETADIPHQEHTDPVQILLPLTLRTNANEYKPVRLSDPGAVIFGYNTKYRWFWKDMGDPEGGEPRSPSEFDHDTEVGDLDSGIGSSISFGPEKYTIGIICALDTELLATRALFDQRHETLPTPSEDINHYALGSISQHNVVAACLPCGEYGTNAGASVLSHMRRSFSNIRICFVVGIAGGVPSASNDIRLGDVVVSQPTGKHPGVIAHDQGKLLENGQFQQTGTLQSPPHFIRTAISSLKSDPDLSSQPLAKYVEEIVVNQPTYKHPGVQDRLFSSTNLHDNYENLTCRKCGEGETRPARPAGDHPMVHYGLIASGNQVVRDAKTRDRLAADGVLCIEMESAGLMNQFPCLVIRGISDYSDSHKNKVWQKYACATAAAYLKLLLSVVNKSDDLESIPVDSESSNGPSQSKKRSAWTQLFRPGRRRRTMY